MSTGNRPLSPHLQVYKFEWTMALSIVHRMTGVGLAAGTLLMVWWLVAMADGSTSFLTVQTVMASWIGRLLLLGWTWALFYHLCNGIRHLVWDTGRGLELPVARASGYVVALASVVLTVAAWVAGYMAMGAL
ncbi:MAG: succinate dehydrogenase, cytochrome b556 subunit [Alphaproteobacteria bacterium]|jgi:succinate dehydrogenase / fumarate reductase cytochrome b subunit|nr:succinate dehydrogenase, cytochrome b556 subunit [Alphaproteobacteria bacterium]|tara:strand:- start:451 stop:846 length:396 start_codon:yes stop_codon:yes gene_type:complete